MGCIYSNLDGECGLWDENIGKPGCDEEGFCTCEEDPDPNVLCDSYESDNQCSECGTDLNIEDCDCE